MKCYEVTIIEKREKTMFVNAGCSTDALIRSKNHYINNSIDLEDCEIKLDDMLCREVGLGVSDNKEPAAKELGEIDIYHTANTIDSCDRIFDCENCEKKYECNNKTKLEHLSELLIDEFTERMAMVYSTYGDEQ